MNSIHSINILKDAAATAMYGSRAANGVISLNGVRLKPESSVYSIPEYFLPDCRIYPPTI